jgi:malate synthase
MATGEIRLSILWEWVHKGAKLTESNTEIGAKTGDTVDASLFRRLLEEEYNKLLNAKSKDVHDGSKTTTLPISREIAEVYVLDSIKAPWFIDLLNINLNNHSLTEAVRRIELYMSAIKESGRRITENLDFIRS